jgi:hypothetical protein
VLAYRPAWSLVYVAWMLPLAELGLLAAGQLHYRLRYREAPGKFRGLIIQVTTTGAEPGRVNEIIGQIRGYDLTMDYRVWVVTEPGQPIAAAPASGAGFRCWPQLLAGSKWPRIRRA